MSTTTQCLIIDDEPLAIDIVRKYIERVPQLALSGSCSNAMEAFQLLNNQKIDLVFLDIEMPEISGIDFIKNLAIKPHVIITTAYREYALESYEIDVIDYLLKPISFERFFKSINKYFNTSTGQGSLIRSGTEKGVNEGSMYVYADKKNIKVQFSDVLYIESIKDYVRICTIDQNIISKDTIMRYESLLPPAFLRVHRSYIVNTSKITAFTQHDIEIGKKEIPIGVSYKKKIIEHLKDA